MTIKTEAHKIADNARIASGIKVTVRRADLFSYHRNETAASDIVGHARVDLDDLGISLNGLKLVKFRDGGNYRIQAPPAKVNSSIYAVFIVPDSPLELAIRTAVIERFIEISKGAEDLLQ